MKIDPNAPVHPYTVHRGGRKPSTVHRGIPIRLELAARAMQGMAAACGDNSFYDAVKAKATKDGVQPGDVIALQALQAADVLIAAYNATEGA